MIHLFIVTITIALSLSLSYGESEAQLTTFPVSLAWDDTQTGLTGYNMYRKIGRFTVGGYVKVNSTTIEPTARTYTDQAPLAKVVCYVCRATIDTDESADSNEVCVATIKPPEKLRK